MFSCCTDIDPALKMEAIIGQNPNELSPTSLKVWIKKGIDTPGTFKPADIAVLIKILKQKEKPTITTPLLGS